jgi:hypothetical protein
VYFSARFISEDTYEGEIEHPLSLNLYIYVGNNPLTNVDPTGHMIQGLSGGGSGVQSKPINFDEFMNFDLPLPKSSAKVYVGNYKLDQSVGGKFQVKGKNAYLLINPKTKKISINTDSGQSLDINVSEKTFSLSAENGVFGNITYSKGGKVQYSKSVTQAIGDSGVTGTHDIKLAYDLKTEWHFPSLIPTWKVILPPVDSEGYLKLVEHSYTISSDLSKVIHVQNVSVKIKLNLTQEISIKKSELPDTDQVTLFYYAQKGAQAITGAAAVKSILSLVRLPRILVTA